MRKQTLSLFLVLAISLSQAHPDLNRQSGLDKYKNFSIENSSCELLNAITLDLNAQPELKELFLAERDTRYERCFSSQEDVARYIKSIDDALSRNADIQGMEKFFWNSQREIIKYGLEVGSSFSDRLPPTLITSFAAPALKKSGELLADDFYDEKIRAVQEQSDEFIKKLIDRAASKDTSLLAQTQLADFERMYALSQADLPSLQKESSPAFNRSMIKQAFNYLKEHRGQIQANVSRLDELTRELNEKLPAFRDELKKQVDDEFRKMGASIATLTKRQEEHTKILDSLQSSVNDNSKRIKALEKQMVDVQGNLVALKQVQTEHTRLIAENSLKINILTGYLFQNLSTDQKLNGLKEGHFDQVFGCRAGVSCPKKDEAISAYEKLKSSETIVSVCGTVSNALNSGYDFAQTMGLLKGEDAKRVGRFVRYLGATLQIGSGAARIYAGDISGIFSVVGGVGSIFGSGPQESPELQFLKQMYAVMVQEFKQVEEALSTIDKKINSLGEALIEIHKTMMASFQYIGDKLEYIDWKTDKLHRITELLLYNKFRTCKTVEKIRLENHYTLRKYSDYTSFYTAECGECLQGLNRFSITDEDSFFHLESIRASIPQADFEIKKVFEPTRNFFRAKYSAPQANLAIGALFFPAVHLKDSSKPLFIVREEGLSTLELDDALSSYINSEMVNQFSNLLLTYSLYFEISDDTLGFKPADLNKHLSRTPEEIKLKTGYVKARFEKLLKLTNYALIQQSLLAGNLLIEPAYATLFTANQKKEDIEIIMEVLNNNQLFARNFASYLLHKNLRMSEFAVGTGPAPSRYKDFAALYERAMQNPRDTNNIAALNRLIYLNNFSFKIGDRDQRLYISISEANKTVDILVPDPDSILENRLINTEAFFGLLQTRSLLVSRLAGLTFTRNLPSALSGSSFTLDDFKYFFHPREDTER